MKKTLSRRGDPGKRLYKNECLPVWGRSAVGTYLITDRLSLSAKIATKIRNIILNN